ncbi:DMT family transporter [Algicella marina]|uniref:EamA family transporter n=1 Tax=Algicella marina TaxID=2683284 RepID=A0A6P1SZX7_9RHOB|nr:DMT family transporter [Algicella marina]QHQ36038.1 EamA family transporter [Algicella marina]
MTNNARLGITLMIATMFVFAAQDGISKHLAEAYNVMIVVIFRYWFFAAFVVARSASLKGGLRRVAKSGMPKVQIFRGVLLVSEICVMVLGFKLLGLVEAHAIFAAYPLIVAALSGPVLGESLGWRRWTAIGIGFVGVLIILRPGFAVFAPEALISLTATLMFALYALLTRYVARADSAETSFFYTGVAGAIAITLTAPFFWEPMTTAGDWGWMVVLCIFGASGHFLLIKTYSVAEAGTVQPFAYLQLVFASAIGVIVFGETLQFWTAVGAGLIIGSGLYALWRAQVRAAKAS